MCCRMTLESREICPEAVPQFRVELADAVLFYTEEDAEEATRFIRRVSAAMRRKGTPIVINCYDDLAQQTSELESVEQVCKVSVQQWFYVTERLVEDKTMRLHKDEQVLKSLFTHRSFVPLWTKPKSEFGETLPYGMAAYRGIDIAPFVGDVDGGSDDDGDEDGGSGDDGAKHRARATVLTTLERMFAQRDHKVRKQELADRRQKEMERWVELERERQAEKKRLEDERHQARLEAMREALRNANLDVPTNPEVLADEYVFQQVQQHRQNAPRSPTDTSSSSPEGSIPPYLLDSLERHRSLMSSTHPNVKNVYNITINNPQNVLIGNTADGAESGAETVVKNIRVNADK